MMRLEKITYPLKRIVNDYKLNKKTSPIITMVLPLKGNLKIFFFRKFVISQFCIFFNHLNLIAMKAFRVKKFDHFLNVNRFEFVLCKDIVDQKLVFLVSQEKAVVNFELQNGKKFLLSLPCNELEFEKFKIRWERFKENEDYYFDLSEWS